MNKSDKIQGCLFGLAMGDAIGLRYENFKPHHINPQNIGKVCLGGIISDDTEQTMLLSSSLVKSKNALEFKKRFRRMIKAYIITAPHMGLTTLRSYFKLFLLNGYGVRGTGNGALMRIAPVGLYFYDDRASLMEYAEISCRLTHNSQECVIHTQAIASLIAEIMNRDEDKQPSIEELESILQATSQDEQWQLTAASIIEHLRRDDDVLGIVQQWTSGRGAVGYTKYSTMLSIICWYKYYGNYKEAIKKVIECGGDTDTNAAICGALMGCTVGYNKLPSDWLKKLRDPTIPKKNIHQAAQSLAERKGKLSVSNLFLLGGLKNIISLPYFLCLITLATLLRLLGIKF